MIYLHGSLTTSKSSPNHSSTHSAVPSFLGVKTQALSVDVNDNAKGTYPVLYESPGARGRIYSMMKPIRRAFVIKKKRKDRPEQEHRPLQGIKFYLKRAAGSDNAYDPMIADMDSCDVAQLLNSRPPKSHVFQACTTAHAHSNDGHQLEAPPTVESSENVIRSVNDGPFETTFLGRSKMQ